MILVFKWKHFELES